MGRAFTLNAASLGSVPGMAPGTLSIASTPVSVESEAISGVPPPPNYRSLMSMLKFADKISKF